MFVFLYLGFKVPVAFYVSYRRKAPSQQEWKALMANFAWEGTSMGAVAEHSDWDGQSSEPEDSNLSAFVPYSTSHSHFSCSIKICIAISYWKAMWQDFLMET